VNIHVNQIRAARGLLGWSQKELAKRSGVSDVSIINYEKGKRTPHQNTLNKIIQAFEFGGVDFTEDGGVRPRQGRIVTYEGREGFIRFFEDIYETAENHENPDLCTTMHEKDLYGYWLGEYEFAHNEMMAKLDIKERILTSETDSHLSSATYSEYRRIPQNIFSDNSFYIYGNKLAFVNFLKDREEVKVTVVDCRQVSDNMRKMFEMVWEMSTAL